MIDSAHFDEIVSAAREGRTMRKHHILMAIVLALSTAGCTDLRMNSTPPIKAVPLSSFIAFENNQGFRNIAPGDIVPADERAILAPRFLNDARITTGPLSRRECFVLPYQAASRKLCEKEASILMKRFADEDGIARCVRSDGSRSFTADADLL